MRKNRWVWCCAMVALGSFGLCATSIAQIGRSSEGAESTSDSEIHPKRQKPIPVIGEIRSLDGSGETADQPPAELCHCVGQDGGPAVAKIKQALAAPLHSSGIEFIDMPLTDVMKQLQDDYGIPIHLDAVALEAVGVRPDEQVSLNLNNTSLQSALRLMLKRLQLTYLIQDEVLIITTPDEAEQQLITCIYDVRDLVVDSKDAHSLRALVDTVVSIVHTETWAENGGGEAEIRPLRPGVLVISQTQAVHDEIRGLLNGIRQVRGWQTAGVAAANVPPAEYAPDVDKVVIRYYTLQINSADQSDFRSQIRSLITQSFPDEQWDGRLGDGQPVVLAVLPDRVVLRQTPEVQEKVQSLLVDSGLTAPTTEVGAMGMGGGAGRGGFFRPATGLNSH